jgi:three-Cys-motif partner protein
MTGRYPWKIGDPLPTLGEHSVAKHNIFEEYVRIYIDRVTRTPSQEKLKLTIVDGFCGGGRYQLGGLEVDGSPFRLLMAVEQAEAAIQAQRRKSFTLEADFIFVDEDSQHIEFLNDQLIKRGYGSRVGRNIFLRCAEFETECAGIISYIRGKGTAHRSLFFLDQYGWSDVRFATIRRILEDLKNPEILLTFAVDALINFLSVKTPVTQGYEYRPGPRRRPSVDGA